MYIVIIFVLVIFFVSTASADGSVPKALPKQESEYKSSDKKAQELVGSLIKSNPISNQNNEVKDVSKQEQGLDDASAESKNAEDQKFSPIATIDNL